MSDLTYRIEMTVMDQPGVLVRVAHIFARRGCNIRAIRVTPIAGSHLSTMSIDVLNVPDIRQIVVQLQKLIEVQSVKETLTP